MTKGEELTENCTSPFFSPSVVHIPGQIIIRSAGGRAVTDLGLISCWAGWYPAVSPSKNAVKVGGASRIWSIDSGGTGTQTGIPQTGIQSGVKTILFLFLYLFSTCQPKKASTNWPSSNNNSQTACLPSNTQYWIAFLQMLTSQIMKMMITHPATSLMNKHKSVDCLTVAPKRAEAQTASTAAAERWIWGTTRPACR